MSTKRFVAWKFLHMMEENMDEKEFFFFFLTNLV
jgi:hypothetical protein